MPAIPGAKIAILQSKWYHEQLHRMVTKTVELLEAAQCQAPEVHILPGSLELPLAAQSLMRKAKYDAIICFGAIMKGETYHFDMIMNMCAQGFTNIMLEEETPIIMEVLPVTSMDHLEARSQDNAFNKGVEAAIAAAEIIDWRRRNLA